MLALVPGAQLIACCDPIDLARAKVRDRCPHAQEHVKQCQLCCRPHAADLLACAMTITCVQWFAGTAASAALVMRPAALLYGMRVCWMMQSFAAAHGCKRAYGAYNELAADGEVRQFML